ncbi:hypothetical protein [Halobacteriovorax sp.]|uniref:hypothetical protein n=1 Tax=Halobacteriovorax sp. TaxID=2020862 RepID=UPI003AF23EED
MSLKFDQKLKEATKSASGKNTNPKSKTNYLIICALALLTHGALIYNWFLNRNLLNLIFMASAIAFAILAIIPMIKEYYAKVRIHNDKELLSLELERINEELSELKESKHSLQIKLSQEIEDSNRLKSDIEKMEADDLEVIAASDDINDQLLLVEDTSKSLDSVVNSLIDARRELIDFEKEMSDSLKHKKDNEQTQEQDEIKFHELFDTFMNEFKDMKDLIFHLKTLSFRVDVQASLSNDSELTQSSVELEGLSRNLAKFFNNTIGLLSNLEQEVRSGQQDLTDRLTSCLEQFNLELEAKQDLSSQLMDLKEQLDSVNEISCDKLDLVREILVDSVVIAEDDLDDPNIDADSEESSVITDTKASTGLVSSSQDPLVETASLIQ